MTHSRREAEPDAQAIRKLDAPELHDLIWLFESEPSPEHTDVVYPFGAWEFESAIGDIRLAVVIGPADRQCKVRLEQGEEELLRLTLDDVARFEVLKREELLRVTVSGNRQLRDLLIKVRPHPQVTWGTDSSR